MNAFSRIKNDNAGAEVPHFQLPGGNDILKEKRSQYNYQQYQMQYKAVCGVMPELDKINNPVCAVLYDFVYMPEDAKKAQKSNIKTSVGKIAGSMFTTITTGQVDGYSLGKGVGGLVGADWFYDFKTEYEEAIKKHKYAYSCISSYDFSDIANIPVGETISKNNLGYRKTEDGFYYEGTWQSGELLYGLLYTPNDGGVAFIGTFDESGMPDEGVLFDGSSYQIGLFKDGELDCIHGLMISLNQNYNGISLKCVIDAGGFEKGRRNGISYRYCLTSEGEVTLFGAEYDFGEEKKKGIFEKKLVPTNSYSNLLVVYIYGYGAIFAGSCVIIMSLFERETFLVGAISGGLMLALGCYIIKKHKEKNGKNKK